MTTERLPALVTPNENRVATASGPLVDDEGHYFNGTDPQTATITATDPAAANGQALSGIKTIRIEEAGGQTLATRTLACSDQCSSSANETLTAPTTGLSEGAHQLQAVVTDLAGNSQAGTPWTVYVDRTAPVMEGTVDVVLEEGDGIADVSWDPVSDPNLPTGDAGSGFATYEVRTRPAGGVWTAPESLTALSFLSVELGSHAVGDLVQYEITARDRVGNVSVFGATKAVALTDITAGDEGDYAPGEPALPNGPVDPGEDASWRNVDPNGEIDMPAPEQTSGATAARSSLAAPIATAAASASYDSILCARDGLGSPCGTYSGRQAAAYARQYAQTNGGKDRNHDYTYYPSDCTNFASQILHFGGLRFMRTRPGINDPRHDDNDLYVTGPGSWWSEKYTNTFGNTKYRNSTSWSVAWVLYNQLMDHGLARIVGGSERMRSGDIIFYWWNGRGRIEDINHVNVVSQVRQRRVYISQHTVDRPNETIRKFDARARAGHPNFDRIVLRPVATRFDLP